MMARRRTPRNANPTRTRRPQHTALTFPLENPNRIVCPVLVAQAVPANNTSNEVEVELNAAQFTALWDTGAESTHVVPRVVLAANLESIGFRPSKGIDGKVTQRRAYRASIVTFSGLTVPLGTTAVRPQELKLHSTTVIGLEEDSQLGGVDVLIGMDIIGRGDFALSYDSNGVRWVSYLHPSKRRRLNLSQWADRSGRRR